MCGFIGFFNYSGPFVDKKQLDELPGIELLKSRGPDELSFHREENLTIYHSRLMINSNKEFGHLPLSYLQNKTLAYNGEVYNFWDLPHYKVNKSDAQVVYENLSSDGPSFIDKCNGAFAMAYKDQENLCLVRDRLGIRSLFYFHDSKLGLIFSTNYLILCSVLKAIGVRLDANLTSRQQYLRYRYIYDQDETFFHQIKQVAPATMISFKGLTYKESKSYWKLSSTNNSQNDSIEQLSELLKDAIKIRTRSITGYSTLLSGGLDSGLITSQCIDDSSFQGSHFLELPKDSSEINRYCEFLSNYPHQSFHHKWDNCAYSEETKRRCIKSLELPIGDSVIYLTDYLFSQVSKHSKVVLTGDGADELFCGYIHQRAFLLGQIFKKIFPETSWPLIFKIIKLTPKNILNHLIPYNEKLDNKQLDKLIHFLKSFNRPEAAFDSLISLNNFEESNTCIQNDFNFIHQDLAHWACNYSLYKIDRLSGAYGLEARTPYYDHRLVEWLNTQMPVSMKNIIWPKLALKRAGALILKQQGSSLFITRQKKFPFRLSSKTHDQSTQDLLSYKSIEQNEILRIWDSLNCSSIA